MKFIIGILVFGVSTFFIALIGTQYDGLAMLTLFIDMPTILWFIVAIMAVIISTGSWKTFIVAMNAILSKKYHISAAEKERAIRLFKLIRKTVIYATVVIITLSLMVVLKYMSEPAKLGSNFSVILYGLFCGAFINLVIVNPALDILKTHYNAETKTMISEKQVIDKFLEMCYKQGITPEEIMEASEISFRKIK
ncbi:hypothetical protein LQZ18_14430 [Lachnospiraceae bacterium ZAX-1]